MALYQPTFVLPDERSGLGQGTIDATGGLTVSWHISGTSALTAFEIKIMSVTAGSAALYSTGQRSDGCPAYGTSPTGDMLFFSFTIPASALAAAGIRNGNQYKYVITQYWNGGSVQQTSASVFLARTAPALSVNNPGTVATRSATFTGSYSQAQGDALNWFRWRMAIADDTANPIFDSGNISGSGDISMQYDGLLSGYTYALRLTCQTENGAEADTGWVSFAVAYDTPASGGRVAAACAKGTDAVYVSWPNVTYIPGTAHGDYGISGGTLSLPAGSYVIWNTVNGGAMSFDPPWSVVWKGVVHEGASGSGGILMITTRVSHGQVPGIQLYYENGMLAFVYWGTRYYGDISIQNVPDGATVTMAVTPNEAVFRVESLTGGLYPAANLYPGAGLYPRADDRVSVRTFRFSLQTNNNAQGAAEMVILYGPSETDFLEIIPGTLDDSALAAALAGSYAPGTGGDAAFSADFVNGLNAGNLDIGDDNLVGYALYRRSGESGVLEHIADVGTDVTALYDYGAASQRSYNYYLFPLGERTYISASLMSNTVTPCFWNWTLLQCAETGERNMFSVTAEYRFRYSVSTGAMSNNNAPNLMKNFTRFPTVQLAPQNYKSGTVTALIGWVAWDGGRLGYADTINLRDAIFALSVSDAPLFLKSRKGDVLRVRVREAITAQTGDATVEQAQTMALSWAEVGSAEGLGIYALSSAAQNSPGSGGASGGGSGSGGRGQIKIVTPSAAEQTITPDAGYDYLAGVIVRGVPLASVQNATGYTAKIGN